MPTKTREKTRMSEKRWFPEGVIEADLVTSGKKWLNFN